MLRRTADVQGRLARLVNRAPEVMVKITGRTHDPARLKAHLDYISRRGSLALEDAQGWRLAGRAEIHELAGDWAAAAATDSRRTARTPVGLSLVLSMPARTDPFALCDAARAFAAETFGDRFDYVFALHTDAGHPHVHLSVCALAQDGGRLNPKKAQLAAWRQRFAAALRARGVEAEATPRRARGVTRKGQRQPLQRLAARAAAGAPIARTIRDAWKEAGACAFGGDAALRLWEQRLSARQRQIRAIYLAQARLLEHAPDPKDRRLGAALVRFVEDMPQPDSRRLALAHALRAAALQRDTPPGGGPQDRAR